MFSKSELKTIKEALGITIDEYDGVKDLTKENRLYGKVQKLIDNMEEKE